jgi:membrane-associated phospholipid phosphatase
MALLVPRFSLLFMVAAVGSVCAVDDACAQAPTTDGEAADEERPYAPRPAATPWRPADRLREVPLAWNPDWPRFRTSELVFTSIMAVTSVASLAIPTSETRWTAADSNAFDRGARDVFLPDSQDAQNGARDASDVLIALMYNQLAVDSVLVAWWGYGNMDTAWQLALIDLQSLALTAAVTNVVKSVASRERPYGPALCEGPEAEQIADCTGSRRYRSFFSGHASSAFTVAGLMCMHHAHLPLYGGGAIEGVTCAASLGAAAATSMTRVMSDQHNMTDVLTGAAVGSLSGFMLPWLLHYRGGALETSAEEEPDERSVLQIRFVPTPTGAGVAGTF